MIWLLAGILLISLPAPSKSFSSRLLVKKRLNENHRKLSMWFEGSRSLEEGKFP